MTALRRVLGPWDVVWFFVTAIVGLRWIASAAAAGPSSLVVWLAALAGFYGPLAFSVIVLSARYPDEGGLYVWTKHAFGDFAGFLAGWMYWMSTVIYFPGLLYFGAGNALFIADPTGHALADSDTYFTVASLAALTVALGLNLVGLGAGKWLHNAGGFGTWMPIAFLVVMGAVCLLRFGPATPIAAGDLVPRATTSDIAFWSTIAFGFGGFEAVAFMGDEVRDPARTVRRAVIIAGAIIAAIYILGTTAVLVALPRGEVSGLQGIMQAIAGIAGRLGWSSATPVLAALITLGTLGGVSAWLGSTSRLPFVAGVDRVLPPVFARLHPRWGTPWVALCVQAGGAALFAWLGQAGTSVKGAYDILVNLGVISYFIPYVLMFAAMIRLDRRPHARAIAAVGLAVTLLSIGLAAIPPPDAPGPGLAVIKVVGGSVVLVVLGMLLYARAWKRTSSPERG
jgi:amino acid transporter